MSDSVNSNSMDPEMIHALSCMVSAQADMIHAMCAANKASSERGEKDVFSHEEMRNAEIVARKFIPRFLDEDREEGECEDGSGSTVLPFPKMAARSADQEEK